MWQQGPFNPATSTLAGMTVPQLQAALANAQAAYISLMTGTKGVTFSYTQGDGAKTVSYTPASIGGLTALIKLLQAQLGIIRNPRRPIRMNFR